MNLDTAGDVSADPPLDSDLLIGKFVPPSVRQGAAERARLLDLCSDGASKRLTIVGAPAGYGKTTLLASWFARHVGTEGKVTAWLSLEQSEDDPAIFWRYVVGALRWAGFVGGAGAASMLQVPGTDVEAAIRSLLNDLRQCDQPVIIVLDDYQLVQDPACHRLFAYFLDHAPETAHVMMATRSAPPLPLASLRAAGQLTEVRSTDLRLTAEEAAEFVRVGEDLPLDDRELELLTARTEGWVAAMHLAVLWLRGEPDQRSALLEFAGDNRHLVDYLGEQVLAGLDPEIERFLLETSILNRFCAPLCDALTGSDDATASIAEIERANLFLIPLDGRRRWFRYHHLFGGLLRAELSRREGGRVSALHERAYGWHRENGTVTECVHHATLAGDWNAAAEAITSSWISLMRSGRSATIQRWIKRFPEEALGEYPELGYVGVFVTALSGGTEAEVGRWLRIAESAAAGAASGPTRLPDGTTSHEVNVNIARAAFIYRDIGSALVVARQVVAQEPRGGQWRVPALAALAFLDYISGDLTESRDAAEQAMGDPDVARRPHGAVLALGTLSLIELDQGDPERSDRTARRALDRAASAGLARSVSSGVAYVALGRALVAMKRYEEGIRELGAANDLLEGRSPIAHHLLALLSLAEAQRLKGDLLASNRAADQAELMIESFEDAGIFPAMLAETKRKSQVARQRRRAAPGVEISETELAVLRLLAGPKSRREIADELCVSLNTVKTHSSSIYRKLDVGSRADAVRAARTLQLL